MRDALLGIDTGGTFTDFVLLRDGEFRVHKVLSNPGAPEQAILAGIDDLGLGSAVKAGHVTIIHGTTVATNATLEGKGVRTAYVTNKGLADVLTIGRQTRAELYNLVPVALPNLFPDELMFEVDCRIDSTGAVITALDEEKLKALAVAIRQQRPVSVAINLLFSFLDASFEEQIESCLGDGYFVSRSSNILPEYREYERGITTWINAWIGPLIYDYLTRLQKSLSPSRISIMQSSGLTIDADQAAARAVNLLLSGPAGGLSASMFIGRRQGNTRLMTFDMGGTSTDVALLDGGIRLTSHGSIANFPVGVPMADIHTIGAGGGSIAYIDDGGLLKVGPASAGADPGPACYGRGGTAPTVTDANLLLGRLRPDFFLGGTMTLDREAAESAIGKLATTLGITAEETAFGIVRIANEHMVQALRVISIQRGFDPRDFTLACFGGAGGLHFCDLAEAMEMTRAILPIHSGVLSALGMLVTPPGRELVRTHRAALSGLVEDDIAGLFAALEDQGQRELDAEGVGSMRSQRSLDLRYQGQTFTINVPFTGISGSEHAFHLLHKQQYGHDLPRAVEVLNIRVHLEADNEPPALPLLAPRDPANRDGGKRAGGSALLAGYDVGVPIVDRALLESGNTLAGPVLVTEKHATVLIKRGWTAVVDEVGNLTLTRKPT